MALEAGVYLRNLKSKPFWMKGLIYKLTFNPRIFDIKSHYFCFLALKINLTNSVTLQLTIIKQIYSKITTPPIGQMKSCLKI